MAPPGARSVRRMLLNITTILFTCMASVAEPPSQSSNARETSETHDQFHFLQAWCPEAELQPGPNTHFERVVDAAWLQHSLNDPSETEPPLVLEVIPNSKQPPRTHIPGAIAFDTAEIEEAPLWNLIPPTNLLRVLESKGIRHDRLVVTYGADLTAVGRVIWTLMYAGVEDVRLLNGGMSDWRRQGGSVSTEYGTPTRSSFGIGIPGRPEFLVGTTQVHPTAQGPNDLVVSVRSRREYLGLTSGYSYIKPKGRIPSARWGHDATSLWNKRTGRLRCPSTILPQWQQMGITPDKRVMFYCGTGWRSSLAFFYAYVVGYDHATNYDGSWLEWSADPTRPIDKGAPN